MGTPEFVQRSEFKKSSLANLHPSQHILVDEIHALSRQLIKCLRDFTEDARQDAGYQIDKVQRGEQPDDFKPMPGIGAGVEEIRIWDESGTYCIVYTA